MDSITLDALRMAFAVSLERYHEEMKKGRSAEFALIAATSSVLPRIGEALEGHERRRSVSFALGKDFRQEAFVAANRLIHLLKTGTSHAEAMADYWKRLNTAVTPIGLFPQ